VREYIEKPLDEVHYDMGGLAKTPAANHLFNTNNAKKLTEERAQLFHHIVAKLLYLCRRTWQDNQTAMAFLCTRLRSPDEDDYKKLVRVIQYIRETHHMTLTIKPNQTMIQGGGLTVHTPYTLT